MKTTLLIMAAGIGSRFGGGIKQLDEYSNAIVHAFQRFRAPFSGKIVHIFPEQSAAFN